MLVKKHRHFTKYYPQKMRISDQLLNFYKNEIKEEVRFGFKTWQTHANLVDLESRVK